MGERLIVGAMSGTSADGVDAALVRIGGKGMEMTARLVLHRHLAYDADLRKAIFAVRSSGNVTLSALADLGRRITLAYAETVRSLLTEANVAPSEVAAIAAHGQTLFHEPPLTIQWFDPSLLAWETGCAVVSDFRRADCAAGGQGAPLVPFADYILFRHPNKDHVLLNIGGIANLTYLRAGGDVREIVAFDTGPGNCISDHLMRQFDPNGPGYDVNGARAGKGRAMSEIVQAVLDNPYFRRSPPKSTDGPAMIAMWENALHETGACNPVYRALSEEDLLATACLITAEAIRNAFELIDSRLWDDAELLVSGGGVRNRTIMDLLQSHRSCPSIIPVETLGWPGEAKEAVAFALLGAATLDGIAGSIPSVTGASRGVVLGSVTSRPVNSSGA